MKTIFTLLLLFGLFAFSNAKAQCPDGQTEIEIQLLPDAFPSEISWTLHDYTSGSLIASGTTAGGVFCVPEGACTVFTIYDSFGDGILASGYCRVYADGVEVFQTDGQAYFELSTTFNCPPGTHCNSPLVVTEGVYEAPNPDFWYNFTADSNGNYTVSTCNLGNTCDTKIYLYDNCPPFQDEGPIGALNFNDNYCGVQSEVTLALEAGSSIRIRIGDSDAGGCAGQGIDWSISYSGPISGCTDTTACNFNPLAEITDLSACEYPEPGSFCDGPDLAPGMETFTTSIFIDNNHFAQQCEVNEGCILGTGQRQLLKYGVTIWNYGNQPYYPGTPQNNPDGYEWAECHNHYHYIGFAESYLYNADFQQVDFARKTSYAIINTDCLPGVTPNGPALAPGCGDTYPAGYECQWVDITDVTPGTYYLVLRVNGPQVPDYLGRQEMTFDNNAIYVCLYIGELSNGDKFFEMQNDCPPFVDCEGTPLGLSVADCAGECNGSRIRGDLDVDTLRTAGDLAMYMEQIVDETIEAADCHQLTNDSTFTVLDAAMLNACLRHTAGEHVHVGGDGSSHAHCNFPFHITNQQQSVKLGLQNVQENYLDISVEHSEAYLQGFELTLNGVVIDSVVNLVGNFNPTVTFHQGGHLMALALDEFPLNKYYQGAVLRVYFSQTTSNTICIGEIQDAVNGNGERISTEIGDCVYLTTAIADVQETVRLSLLPNPTTGLLNVNIEGGLLGDATLRLTDLTGQVLWQEKRQDKRQAFSADLSGVPAGIYFLSVENERFTKTERIVVAR